jgi:hypothetical protein
MSQYANPYAPPASADPYGALSGPAPDGAPVDGGAVPDAIVEHLRGTRPWVMFLAVIGFLGSGLIVLLGLGVAIAGALGTGSEIALMVGMGCGYVVLGGIYVLPAVGLVRYGTAIERLVRHPRMELLGAAIDQQRWFWKVVGIMTAVVIALYPIGIMVAGIVVAAKAIK